MWICSFVGGFEDEEKILNRELATAVEEGFWVGDERESSAVCFGR